jgi:hypothetical protein
MGGWIEEPLDFIAMIRIKDDGYAYRHPPSPRGLDRPRRELRGPEMMVFLAGHDFEAHPAQHRAPAGRTRPLLDLSKPGNRRPGGPRANHGGQG